MIITGKNYIEFAQLSCATPIENQIIDNLKIPQLSKAYKMLQIPNPIECLFTSVIRAKCIVIDRGTLTSNAEIEINLGYVGSPTFTLESNGSSFFLLLDKIDTTGLPGEFISNHIDSVTKEFIISTLNIEIIDSTNTEPEIGYIHIGDYLQLPPINPSAGLYYSTTTQKTKSISGQQYTDKGYQFVSTSFDFPRIPDTEEVFLGKTVAGRQEILSTWSETEFQCAWLFPWEQSLDKIPPIFGSMDSNSLQFDRSETDGLYWSMSFNFSEIK